MEILDILPSQDQGDSLYSLCCMLNPLFKKVFLKPYYWLQSHAIHKSMQRGKLQRNNNI